MINNISLKIYIKMNFSNKHLRFRFKNTSVR